MKIPASNLMRVRNKSEVIDEARKEGRKAHFADGHLSFEECRIGDETPEVQRSNVAPRRRCEWRFRLLRSIHKARIISITNDGSKSNGYYFKATWIRRTSSWCTICLDSSYNGRCSEIAENSKIGMSGHMDTSTTTRARVFQPSGPVGLTPSQ